MTDVKIEIPVANCFPIVYEEQVEYILSLNIEKIYKIIVRIICEVDILIFQINTSNNLCVYLPVLWVLVTAVY